MGTGEGRRGSRCRSGHTACMKGGRAASVRTHGECPQWMASRPRPGSNRRVPLCRRFPDLSGTGSRCPASVGAEGFEPSQRSSCFTGSPDSPASARSHGAFIGSRTQTFQGHNLACTPVHHKRRARGRTRTCNTLLVGQVLSHLSYAGLGAGPGFEPGNLWRMRPARFHDCAIPQVHREGLEPSARRLRGGCLCL